MMLRITYLAICGLVFAGIVHIIVVLLIPTYGSKDAAGQIVERAEPFKFREIASPAAWGISNADPYFRFAVCNYDLTNAAARIESSQSADFWSASVFAKNGDVVYSLSKRTAIGGKLDMILVNPIQRADMRQSQPEELESSIVVEANNEVGFVLLRAFVRDLSLEDQAQEFLSNAKCTAYETR